MVKNIKTKEWTIIKKTEQYNTNNVKTANILQFQNNYQMGLFNAVEKKNSFSSSYKRPIYLGLSESWGICCLKGYVLPQTRQTTIVLLDDIHSDPKYTHCPDFHGQAEIDISTNNPALGQEGFYRLYQG